MPRMRTSPPRPGLPPVVTPGRRLSTSLTELSPKRSMSSLPMMIFAAVDARRWSVSLLEPITSTRPNEGNSLVLCLSVVLTGLVCADFSLASGVAAVCAKAGRHVNKAASATVRRANAPIDSGGRVKANRGFRESRQTLQALPARAGHHQSGAPSKLRSCFPPAPWHLVWVRV